MGNATMKMFWIVTMVLGLAAGMWSMTILASLSSNHLYSQAIDASVTTATVNQVLNSGVQIANANAAAVASISGEKEIPLVNITNSAMNPSLAPPQSAPQALAAPPAAPASNWVGDLVMFGVKIAIGMGAMLLFLVLIQKVV